MFVNEPPNKRLACGHDLSASRVTDVFLMQRPKMPAPIASIAHIMSICASEAAFVWNESLEIPPNTSLCPRINAQPTRLASGPGPFLPLGSGSRDETRLGSGFA